MNLNLLQDNDYTNKKVLMRVDFNVDIEALKNKTESFRLTLTQESINAILAFPGTTITLITHFGRPEGEKNLDYSVAPLISVLQDIYGQKVSFTSDVLGTDDFSEARIALRENIRFYKEEELNDRNFAERLATDFDVYVNEAFSVSHRKHASVVAITEFLPGVAGIHLQKEVRELTEALVNPSRPAIAILGGAKIETKLPLIHVFEHIYDAVLLGGRIANEAIDQGLILKNTVHLPIDFRGAERFDIGDKTIEQYQSILGEAKTIVWNGPLGKFEEPPYDTGTNAIVETLARSEAYIIAGGGESLAAIQKAGIFDELDVVSSGGGAMLDFLAGESLPGLDGLQVR